MTAARPSGAASTAQLVPLVSVVVPAFNAARFIETSVASILGQTYDKLEVVVVDDASTDDTADVLARIGDERLRVIRNERNLGQFGAINVGIAHARGEIVAIQHADDEYLPAIVERQVAVLDAHPDAGAAFALDVFVDEAGREYSRVVLPDEFNAGGLLTYGRVLNGILRHGNSFVRGGTSFVRREVYEAVGQFSTDDGLRGDIEMWLRVAAHRPIVINPEYLTRYRWGHDNESSRYGRLRADPELSFGVIDRRLAAGDAALAEADALAAYEGRRAEDLLIVTANRYVIGNRKAARQILARVSPRALLRTRQVQRGRLLVLWLLLHLLVRLPRVGAIASLFYRRWGAGPRAAVGGVAS